MIKYLKKPISYTFFENSHSLGQHIGTYGLDSSIRLE